ncbi:MAG TPA: tetratricopeptide repeat protein [Cyclobacteriaceae bacterium]|nr:tetratricopeptide repeat protein [Cyclobacteriaceae bacterium]
MNATAVSHYNDGKYSVALQDYKQLLKINNELNIDSLIAQNLNDLGMVFYRIGALDSSLYYYDRARSMYEQINNPKQLAIVRLNLAMIYKDKGVYEKALKFALNAAAELNVSGSPQAQGSCLNTIALIYTRLKAFDSALEFHRKALAVRIKINNEKAVAQSYNNLANLFKETRVLDSAQYYYEKSLQLKRQLGDWTAMASTLNNLGEIFFARNDLRTAEEYYRQSLAIKKEQSNNVGEVITLNNLAQLALTKKEYALAQEYLNESARKAERLGLLEELKTNYEFQVHLQKATKNPTKALEYAEKLIAVKDSLLTKEMAESFAELKQSYDIVTREQEISLLEQDNALQQANLKASGAWIKGLLIAAILFTIVLVLVFRLFQMEQKNKRRVETLLQELHHRVKNNLQLLSSILGLQSQELTDQNALKAVKSSEGRINAMALIHRRLYAGDQNRTINIKTYTSELTTYLVHAYGYYGKDLKLNLSLEDIQVDVDKAIPLGLIINELISNAFKYAYIDHPVPELSIGICLRHNNELHINVKDNGNGYNAKKDTKSTSFGLKMVNMLMDELKGKYEVDARGGTSYHLQIPLE